MFFEKVYDDVSDKPFEYRFCAFTCSELYQTLPSGIFCWLSPVNSGKGSSSCCLATVAAFNEVPGSRPWNGFGTCWVRAFVLPPCVTSPSARFCFDRAL